MRAESSIYANSTDLRRSEFDQFLAFELTKIVSGANTQDLDEIVSKIIQKGLQIFRHTIHDLEKLSHTADTTIINIKKQRRFITTGTSSSSQRITGSIRVLSGLGLDSTEIETIVSKMQYADTLKEKLDIPAYVRSSIVELDILNAKMPTNYKKMLAIALRKNGDIETHDLMRIARHINGQNIPEVCQSMENMITTSTYGRLENGHKKEQFQSADPFYEKVKGGYSKMQRAVIALYYFAMQALGFDENQIDEVLLLDNPKLAEFRPTVQDFDPRCSAHNDSI